MKTLVSFWQTARKMTVMSAALWCYTPADAANTWPVTSPSDNANDPNTLRNVINNNAVSGDSISIEPIINGTTITLTQGKLVISKNLTIIGQGASKTAVVNPGGQVFVVAQNITLNLGGLYLSGNLSGPAGADGNPNGDHGDVAQGGCIWCNQHSSLTVTNCYFEGCLASGGRGGNSLTHTGGTSGSGGFGGSANGGAIYSLSNVGLYNCTFANNYARGGDGGTGGIGYDGGPGGAGGNAEGGAVWLSYNGVLTVVNCTFSANHAAGGNGGTGGAAASATGGPGGDGGNSSGGAIAFGEGCDPASCEGVLHSTVSGNDSTAGVGGTGGIGAGGVPGATGNTGHAIGGGLYVPNTVPIGNTIVAGNHAFPATSARGQDVRSLVDVSTTGYNLIGASDDSSGWSAATDLLGWVANPLDAHLGPLQNNGGEMPTMAPMARSPAIDAGTVAGYPLDQIGQARPDVMGTLSDIGAFEVQGDASPPRPRLIITPSSGGLTIAWPAPSTGFVLQETSDPGTPNWVDNTNPIIVVGTQNHVTVPTVFDRRFYRLVQR